MNFLILIFIFLDPIDCLYSKCHPVKPDVINVHLVPHSHDDTGYRKTVDEYFYGLNNDANVFSGGTKGGIQYTIYSVLDALERNPERRFNQVEMAFFWRWWREASQEDQERLRAVIRSGQFNFLLGRGFNLIGRHFHQI